MPTVAAPDYSKLYGDMDPARAAAPVAAPVGPAEPDPAEVEAEYQKLIARRAPPGAKSEPASPAAPHAAAPALQRRDDMPDSLQPAAAPKASAEQDWGDTLSEAAGNLVPSTGRLLKSSWDAVTNPGQTIEGVRQLGAGVASKVSGWTGEKQDHEQKAKTEAVVDALVDHYKQTYGSVPGFKAALAKDPASILLDASTLAGGAGAAGKLAGVGAAANVAAKASSALDPIANAMRVAGVAKWGEGIPVVGGKTAGVITPVVSGVRHAAGAASGVSPFLQKLATAAGATTDPELRAVYEQFSSGKGDPADYLTAAQAAVRKVRDAESAKYVVAKGGMAAKPVNLDGVMGDMTTAEGKLQQGSALGWRDAKDAAQQARDMVEDLYTHPDPAKRSLDEVDALKQQLWDLSRAQTPGSKAQAHVNGVYHSVRNSLIAADPEYANLMESYQTARNSLTDATKGLGTGNNASATTAMAKALRQSKTANGQTMLSTISDAQRGGDPRLPYMLAGLAAHDALPGGVMRSMADVGVGALLYHVSPVGALASAAAASPKIVQGANKLAGTASRVGAAVPARGAAYAGRLSAPVAASAEPAAPAAPPGRTPDTAVPMPARTEEPEKKDPTDANFERMIQMESGGHQTDAAGNTTTSRKGAIGVAQIMPGSGPTAALAAGEKWDPQRAATDPDYNRKLGRSYYGALVHTFGDHEIAAAAYNAGPGKVAHALRLAQQAGGHYLDYLPTETRNYVAGLRGAHADGGRVARASGGRIGGAGHEKLVARLMKMATSAKTVSDKATEPLLQAPDEHIVKALSVAQRAI